MEMLDDGKQNLMIPSDRTSEWNVSDGCKVDHLHNWNDPLKHNDYQTTVNDLCTDHYKELNISGNFEYHNKVDKLLKQFMVANTRNEWPESTPIYCFWCCFPFTGKPCALPTDFDGTTFKVYGCFCSQNVRRHIILMIVKTSRKNGTGLDYLIHCIKNLTTLL